MPNTLAAALDIFPGPGTGHDRERARAKWGTDAIVEYADHGNRDMGRGGRVAARG